MAGHRIPCEQLHGFSYAEPWIVEGAGLETIGHYYPWPNEKNCSQGKHRTDLLTERFCPARFRSFHNMARLATSRPLLNPSLIPPEL